MRDVVVLGVGMTRFGKFPDRGLKDLSREAVEAGLVDAGIPKQRLEAAYVGNAIAGLITGQEMIRGQVVLRAMGIGDLPVINTENACATGSTAFHLAWIGVASGLYDCVLALGVEKMALEDKRKTFHALGTAVDVEAMGHLGTVELKPGAGESRSLYMDLNAHWIREYMARWGATKIHLARVSAKNHFNGSLNPFAQYRQVMSVEEVLHDAVVVEPLTRAMCSSIGDGAAAAVLSSDDFARRFATKPVYVAASVLRSGRDRGATEPAITERTSRAAYEVAGIGPNEVDVLEVHDATASGELFAYEQLGLCGPGEAARLIDEGTTELRGRTPVNPSGGLECRGHPIGATGLAQIVELVWQLRGQSHTRQVTGPPAVGLAQNRGGHIGAENENVACCITIVKR